MGPNQQQSQAWNGPEAAHYVDQADRYDRQLAPVADSLIRQAALEPSHAVLDVGCGSGATTLAAARVAERVVGVDISRPLVDVAIGRARRASLGNAEFLVADAQVHPFDQGAFDVVIAQFGLMFFDDPAGAFSNLRRAMAPGGRIVFTAWQGLAANEWLAPVVRAVEPHKEIPDLGGLANGPGMFAMRSSSDIAALLDEVGFRDVEIGSISPTLLVGGGGTLEETTAFLLGMGIVRGLLSGIDDAARDLAVESVRADLARHDETGVGVRLGAGVWLVSAHA